MAHIIIMPDDVKHEGLIISREEALKTISALAAILADSYTGSSPLLELRDQGNSIVGTLSFLIDKSAR